uniref:Uncharacterized protein n=1 Tax=Amphimedon queenslandica TaxID=400682 RepID=A0A1X7SWA9_AMPQE
MEPSLLEAKTGNTNNNEQTTAGLAESVETRWIITERDKNFTGCSSTLTEVLVGVDIRTETGNRTEYPRIEIWGETGGHYRDPISVELRLSPHNFTTNGLYRVTLPTPLNISELRGNGTRGYRLGVYQPPDDRSVVRFYKNQTTSKHYPNIYLKRSSELIHALTVDASAATSSNGNVYLFTSDIEVEYGDILVINVTTNSNPMYYQQYNGPLNYELDSSNGLIPLEHNDYPLISVVV